MPYCSLQHWTLFLSPVTSTTGCCFCFGSLSSFFLELFFHWSPVAYWAPTDLGSSSFSVLSFSLFILFMGFSRQEYWSGLHALLQWTTFCQNSPPWSIHLGWPYTAWLSFIELDKAVVHMIRLVSFLCLWFQSVCPLMPSLSAYHLTGVSLTWDVGYLFMLIQQSSATASYLGRGVSPHGYHYWPWTWGISSQLLAAPALCSYRSPLHIYVGVHISPPSWTSFPLSMPLSPCLLLWLSKTCWGMLCALLCGRLVEVFNKSWGAVFCFYYLDHGILITSTLLTDVSQISCQEV